MIAPVSVVELAAYRRRESELPSSDECDDAIVDLIAYDPGAGNLIPGTGGLRKLRIGRDSTGKRGGARVIYYFHNESMPLFLLALYAKNERSDLSIKSKRKMTSLVKEIVIEWTRK